MARAVADGKVDRGILVCGSGLGMCMAANRVSGARAASISEPYAAKMSRRHNDSNILCLGGRLSAAIWLLKMVNRMAERSFEGGRHQRRVELIDRLTQREPSKSDQ